MERRPYHHGRYSADITRLIPPGAVHARRTRRENMIHKYKVQLYKTHLDDDWKELLQRSKKNPKWWHDRPRIQWANKD